MSAAARPATAQCETLAELLPQLPRIMRSRGWLRGTALMEGWFRRPANSDPKRGVPDTHTIKMGWVLSYPRAAQVYYDMLAEKVWITPAARETLIRQLKRNNKIVSLPGATRDFGGFPTGVCLSPYAVSELDKTHIQHRRVNQGTLSAPMDDLTAALANFNFQVIVKGQVKCLERSQSGSKARFEATISQVGIYVKDFYDFNDNDKDWMSQPLGFWGCEDDYAGKNPFAGHYVNNKSFRDWRDKHGQGHGGDFIVFSDNLVTQTNDSFNFEA